MKTIVIAIGGNSLIKDADHMGVADQYAAVVETGMHIADVLEQGHRVVISHGNGPQVGFMLLRSEHSRGLVHELSLDYIGATTQGSIGYQIQQALSNEFRQRGMSQSAITVVTQTIVDANDPAFQKPTKPIGQFYSQAEADDRIQKDKWVMVEDAGRGWRRVVASPKPVQIFEADIIKHLVDQGYVVIAAGGGGIPVVRNEKGELTGAIAVIDKDLGSAVLAEEIGADLLVISTAVEKVCLDYGKPTQRTLDLLTLSQAKEYMAQGHFKPGSMLPKIQACIQFLEQGGHEALITCPEALGRALKNNGGTRIVPDGK